MNRRIDEVIAQVEAAETIPALSDLLQAIAETCGFSAFSFLDGRRPGDDNPLVVNTISKGFDADYRGEKLLHVDPMIPVVRRTNTPFSWGSVPLPVRRGKKIPGALKTMHVARDHGYREGLVIPFHYVDRIGRPYSSVCTFFWTDADPAFLRNLEETRLYLHIVVIYWAQRAVDLWDMERKAEERIRGADNAALSSVFLTDRERDVLSWAGRGKTVQDTADILLISADTVESHVRACLRKLEANNKTHAVAKAIYLRLIDV